MTPTLRSRRLVLVAGALLLGLTACGSPGSAAQPTTTRVATPGTSPVSAPPTTVRQPKVIRVTAAGRAGATPSVAAGEATTGGLDTKMRVRPMTFVWSGAVPPVGPPAPAWSFPAGAAATESQVAALAAAFGVTGSVRTLPADQGGGWQVGSTDGTGPSITVGADSMLSWWYSPAATAPTSAPCETLAPPAASSGGVVGATGTEGGSGPLTTMHPGPPAPMGAAAAGTGEGAAPAASAVVEASPVSIPAETTPVDVGGTVTPCAEPTPPAGVPTQAEAKAKALELLAKLGIDPASTKVEVNADQWNANVTTTLQLGGTATNLTTSVGFGGAGAVTWASGFLAIPVRGDDYPLISVTYAVQRLNDQMQMPIAVDGVPIGAVAKGAPAPGVVSAADEVISVATTDASQVAQPLTTSVEPMPVPPTVIGCDPACPPPSDVTPITVTITAAEPSLEQVWAEDGTVWLVPGYRFTADDGGIYSVPAVDGAYLQQIQPQVTPDSVPPTDVTVVGPVETTVPVSTPPATTPPADPTTTVAGEPATTVAGGPVTSLGTPACGIDITITTWDPSKLSLDAVKFLVGLCVDDAVRIAKGLNVDVRVVRVDGVDQPATADFSDRRVNVAVVGGVVTELISIG